ncbi:Tn3 family transposase [Sulfurovum sp. bin170]|uniref:Tn3 family transposase n=1 Tax=Sulfurovum sp. bin170 TaxID=2695268 RepID=UPI0013DF7DC0|nr:Tn3 family transposase [Sulfurovum sp. bin170]NEW61103.1 Tn3 family transposase [Sulfurovum sp. bin170]
MGTTLRILTKEEEKFLEQSPKFTYQQKEYFFKLPSSLMDTLISVDKASNKTLLILMFGYFKATNRFFKIESSDENLFYIEEIYNLKKTKIISSSSRTIQRYKRLIKTHLGIKPYDNSIEKQLQQEAINLANNFVHRKKILYSLIEFSKKLKIEIPSYSELLRIISVALSYPKINVLNKLESYLNDERLKVLDDFLDKNSSYKNKYNIIQYKRIGHSTNRKQMLLSLEHFSTIKSKFNAIRALIETIGVTPKMAQYYARWIEKGKTTQLTQKDKLNTSFLLLSFIYYQYLIRNDNLIDRFISIVQSAKNSSLRSQKDASFEQEPNKNRIIQSLEESNLSMLNEIDAILKNETINASKKVDLIKQLVEQKSRVLTEILSEKKLFESSVDKRYEFIEKKSKSLQGKLSGVVKALEFDEPSSHKNIIEAINYFKNRDGDVQKDSPRAFLSEEEQQVIFEEGKFRISLYKILLFFHIGDAIKSGRLNLKHSYRYQNFESYLIDKEEWKKYKDALLKTYNLEHLKELEKFLEPIKSKLESSYKQTNERIIKELNTNFRLTADSFILKTPKLEKEPYQEESISKYFPQSDYLSVIDVLHSINQETNFLEAFQHYSQSKRERNQNLLLASVLGYGCNINISKIGKISKGINENQLDNTRIWYFTGENTIEANNRVITFMDTLDIVKLMRSHKEENHTSSDGQKFNMNPSVDSTNAGHSLKYFGFPKGVSVYTFIDESHQLFHSQVINVSERESGYVIDGLMHNDVIKSDIHSTDTHGYSEVIFGLTHLLGFSFAPRIKNFKKQQLYSFNFPKEYHALGYKLIPKHKIKEQIMKENWDDILRFVVTIKSRKTTTSQLLKRLTSYSRQHKLYRAIKEFGKIIKTDFLLTYIDNVELRQRIEKQLNKVEASNKFSKAVFFGNNAEFQVSTVEEQNIANNSKRLIQNSIILWNYLYMSKKIQQAQSQKEKDEIIQAIQNSSTVHWSHINFYGEYDFTKRSKRVSAMIRLDKEELF